MAVVGEGLDEVKDLEVELAELDEAPGSILGPVISCPAVARLHGGVWERFGDGDVVFVAEEGLEEVEDVEVADSPSDCRSWYRFLTVVGMKFPSVVVRGVGRAVFRGFGCSNSSSQFMHPKNAGWSSAASSTFLTARRSCALLGHIALMWPGMPHP